MFKSKRFASFIAIAALALSLTGCMEYTVDDDAPGAERFKVVSNSSAGLIDTLVDNETGCVYLMYGSKGIAPLLDENGQPTGCNGLQSKEVK